MQLEEMETFEYIDVYKWRSNQVTLSCSDGPAFSPGHICPLCQTCSFYFVLKLPTKLIFLHWPLTPSCTLCLLCLFQLQLYTFSTC